VLYIVPEKCDRWITKSPVSIKMWGISTFLSRALRCDLPTSRY
jgi:hypothetical protein